MIPGSLGASDSISFEKHVYPILKSHCLSFHSAPYIDARNGRSKKPKGGVRLDTKKNILAGYFGDEDQPVKLIVPGKPDQSPLYATTVLPVDHDDIMPAKGEPLTRKQQESLRQWIVEGAQFGGFELPVFVHPNAKK